jgi:hypothetical protein
MICGAAPVAGLPALFSLMAIKQIYSRDNPAWPEMINLNA